MMTALPIAEASLLSLAVLVQCHHQLLRAYVDAKVENVLLHLLLVHLASCELASSSGFRPLRALGADLEHAGSQAFDSPRRPERGAGAYLRNRLFGLRAGSTSPPERHHLRVPTANIQGRDSMIYSHPFSALRLRLSALHFAARWPAATRKILFFCLPGTCSSAHTVRLGTVPGYYRSYLTGLGLTVLSQPASCHQDLARQPS